jgi:hypothetical protein
MSDFEVFWLFIAAIAISGIYFRHQTAAKRSQVIQAMVEKGTPVPPDLLQEPRRPPAGSKSLISTGIVLLGVAPATLVFFIALTSNQFGLPDRGQIAFLPFLSAFPFFIGLACLVAGRYLKSQE